MVSMATMIIIMVIVASISEARVRKRFIYDTANSNQGSQSSPYFQPISTGQFCSFCPIRCSNGYVTSSSGCSLCICKTTSSSGNTQGYVMPSSGASSYSYQSSSHVYLPNPCLPHVRYCNTKCPNGLLLGPNGCQYCACALIKATTHPSTNVTTVSVTMWTKAPYNKPTISSITVKARPDGMFLSKPCSPHIRYCRIKCAHGLKLGQNGCQYCQCADNSTTIVPSTPTPPTNPVPSKASTRHTATMAPNTIATTTAPPRTRPPPKKNPNFFDPCIPSQTTCDKGCEGNYVKGPQGCQYCICMSRIPESIRLATTEAPIAAYRPMNETQDHQVMTEACLVAKAICQMQCPNGFESAADCLYCKCITKSQADDPTSDLGFKIELPTPCVQGLDQCYLPCSSGYLLGPRECQFCTCWVKYGESLKLT